MRSSRVESPTAKETTCASYAPRRLNEDYPQPRLQLSLRKMYSCGNVCQRKERASRLVAVNGSSSPMRRFNTTRALSWIASVAHQPTVKKSRCNFLSDAPNAARKRKPNDRLKDSYTQAMLYSVVLCSTMMACLQHYSDLSGE